ncbi:hypothetical protein QAD02_021006 [Eretmocerus hayati]|uniref:Uncharacterized protein n=1 Tax=Eretmocerus hayati TaxID=131215 RepID=A0ACC2PQB9_9HYME|nr:hypothetical protein QAD02_021006 [Eretmocerus hayati]
MLSQGGDPNNSVASNGTIPKNFPDSNQNLNPKPVKRPIDSIIQENFGNIAKQSLVKPKKSTPNPLENQSSLWLPPSFQPSISQIDQEEMLIDETLNFDNNSLPCSPEPNNSSSFPNDPTPDDSRSIASDTSNLAISHRTDIFGHLKKWSNSKTKCDHCGETDHQSIIFCPNSEKDPCCANCKLNHKPTDPTCPAKNDQVKIHDLAFDENISLDEARQIYFSKRKQSRFNPPSSNSITSRSFSQAVNVFQSPLHTRLPNSDALTMLNNFAKTISEAVNNLNLNPPRQPRVTIQEPDNVNTDTSTKHSNNSPSTIPSNNNH